MSRFLQVSVTFSLPACFAASTNASISAPATPLCRHWGSTSSPKTVCTRPFGLCSDASSNISSAMLASSVAMPSIMPMISPSGVFATKNQSPNASSRASKPASVAASSGGKQTASNAASASASNFRARVISNSRIAVSSFVRVLFIFYQFTLTASESMKAKTSPSAPLPE